MVRISRVVAPFPQQFIVSLGDSPSVFPYGIPRCLGFCWVPHPAYYSDDMQWYSAAEVDRLRDAANATAAVFMHVRQDEFVILYPDGGISVEDGMNCRVVGGTVSEVLAHLRSRDEKGT